MNLNIHIVFACCLCSIYAHAQTIEDFQKQEAANLSSFKNTQLNELESLKKDYTNFINERDSEWSDYLKTEWENFQIFKGSPLPSKQKPVAVPHYEKQEKGIKDTVQRSFVDIARKEKATPLLPAELIRKTETPKQPLQRISLSFFGVKADIPFDNKLVEFRSPVIDNLNISKFWEHCNQCDYSSTIENLLDIKNDRNLNDFGYLLLIQKIADSAFPQNPNNARLLSWFFLIRSGYTAKIGFNDNQCVLLIPTAEKIYQKNYLSIGERNFYMFPNLDFRSLSTYENDYIEGRIFEFSIHQPIRFAGRVANRSLTFGDNDKTYSLNLQYDPDLIDFYKECPSIEVDAYFSTPASVVLKQSLAESFRPLIANMNDYQAANFLLHFVQTAFQYKTDVEQFSKEKCFFPDEMLFYPFCDCEDRSVFYSYLVRELLSKEVVGLEYPNHMATAVALNESGDYDQVLINNKPFIISDPTYINAPLGVCMPQYRGTSPKIHTILSNQSESEIGNKLWDKLEKAGLHKWHYSNNIQKISDSEYLLAGFYTGAISIDSFSLHNQGSGRSGFIASMNAEGKIQWLQPLATTKDVVCETITPNPISGYFLTGSFSKNIRLGNKTYEAENEHENFFIASISANGIHKWLSFVDKDSLPKAVGTSYQLTFDNERGRIHSIQRFHNSLHENQIGLRRSSKTDNILLYTGMEAREQIIKNEIETPTTNTATNVDIADLLQRQSKVFISQNTDKDMAGLLAAIRLVKDMKIVLSGSQIQKAMDQSNPRFKNLCPNIYKNMGMIQFVRNSKGIINIYTEKGKDISFDKVRICNNSAISISELPDLNFKLEVLSGIKVGKMVVWFNLNFIKLFSKNGNMIFDYSSDHSQAILNLKKDVLN